MDHKKLTHQVTSFAFGTAFSRMLGYIRDMLVAHTFGAGLFADAFYAAYRIPNLLRRILGEGSLSAAFIPVFSESIHKKSKEETQYFLNVLFTALLLILAILTILGIIFAPQIVKLIAYGFSSDAEKISITIYLTRIMFPFLFFICLAALALGILNTLGSFFVPAIAPASLSISEIVFILALAPALSPEDRIKGLAISVTIGGLGQLLVQLPKIKRLGWKLNFNLNLNHPDLKKVGILILPAMIGLSVDQINAFVNTICASFLQQGSITALYYSNRLMQLPLAIFGIAMASASLPSMSKAVAQNDIPVLKNTYNFSTKFVLFILIPSAAGLMTIGLPIIRVLFERGRFDALASSMTNSALFYYSLGLPAYALAKISANAFYSFQNTKTPVKVASVAMILNAILCILLMRHMGVGGLALATAVSSWFNVFVLGYLLQRKLKIIDFNQNILILGKIIIASSVMGSVCYWIAFVLFVNNIFLGMTLSIAGGIVIYFTLAAILKIEERKYIWDVIKQKYGKQ
ncbi:MAG: murein biosynthesis integral membrane protein MurJ [Endomicrobiales bacterium]|nr:murein biosynthesis integral membrane protein MurJ [Endomicrobiales bacterium]